MRLIPALFLVCLASCTTTGPRYSQAQINAIETRTVEAPLGEAFNAASSALFDAGYTIAMSDREGGLITGQREKDNTSARIWVSPFIKDTKFVITIQIRETTSKECTARIKTSVNGEPRVDKAAIDQIWVLMQRQVLMKAPPLSPDTPAQQP